jgi:hypothetical protein
MKIGQMARDRNCPSVYGEIVSIGPKMVTLATDRGRRYVRIANIAPGRKRRQTKMTRNQDNWLRMVAYRTGVSRTEISKIAKAASLSRFEVAEVLLEQAGGE